MRVRLQTTNSCVHGHAARRSFQVRERVQVHSEREVTGAAAMTHFCPVPVDVRFTAVLWSRVLLPVKCCLCSESRFKLKLSHLWSSMSLPVIPKGCCVTSRCHFALQTQQEPLLL